jgi:hypothetical protein
MRPKEKDLGETIETEKNRRTVPETPEQKSAQ